MKKKTFLAGTFVGGCGSQNSDTTVNASEEYTLEDLCIRNFMCPRYNADGSLYTD